MEFESMADVGEAKAYDRLVSAEQGGLLDTCFTLSVLDAAPAGGVILDLGVGTGRIPLKIRQFSEGHRICCLDISQSMLQIAVQNIQVEKARNIYCIQADMKRLPFADASVDMVVSHVALHHLPDPTQALREVARVLKPEGSLLIRDLKRPRNRIVLGLYVQMFGGGGGVRYHPEETVPGFAQGRVFRSRTRTDGRRCRARGDHCQEIFHHPSGDRKKGRGRKARAES